MQTKQQFIQSLFSVGIIFILIVSAFSPSTAHAQEVGGLRREVNAQTGRASFLLPEGGDVLPAGQALSGMSLAERRADPAMALAQRFGGEFGLKDPRRELVELRREEF
ncbi:MAG TPA: hypothetical protein VFH34_10145, partial [Anaerolineales bacterium]|nr:hypothetical protein [Anaerolineales bacterium]